MISIDALDAMRDVITMEESPGTFELVKAVMDGKAHGETDIKEARRVFRRYGLLEDVDNLPHRPLDCALTASFNYLTETRPKGIPDASDVQRLVIAVALSSRASRHAAIKQLFGEFIAEEMRVARRNWTLSHVSRRHFDTHIETLHRALCEALANAVDEPNPVPLAHGLRAVQELVTARPGDAVRRYQQGRAATRAACQPLHPFALRLQELIERACTAAFASTGIIDVMALCPPQEWEAPATKIKNEWAEIAGMIASRFLDRSVLGARKFASLLTRDADADSATLQHYARESRKMLTEEEASGMSSYDEHGQSLSNELKALALAQVTAQNLESHQQDLRHNRALADAREELLDSCPKCSPITIGDYVILINLEKEWALNGRSGFVTGVEDNAARVYVAVELDWSRRSETRAISAKSSNVRLAAAKDMPMELLQQAAMSCTLGSVHKTAKAVAMKAKLAELEVALQDEASFDNFDQHRLKTEMAALFSEGDFRAAVRTQYRAPNATAAMVAAERESKEKARSFAEPRSSDSGRPKRVGKKAAGKIADVAGGAQDLFQKESLPDHDASADPAEFYNGWTDLNVSARRASIRKVLVDGRPASFGTAVAPGSPEVQAEAHWYQKCLLALDKATRENHSLLTDIAREIPFSKVLRRAVQIVRTCIKMESACTVDFVCVSNAMRVVMLGTQAISKHWIDDTEMALRIAADLTAGDTPSDLWECCDALSALASRCRRPEVDREALGLGLQEAHAENKVWIIHALTAAVGVLSCATNMEDRLPAGRSAFCEAGGGFDSCSTRALSHLVPIALHSSPSASGTVVCGTIETFLNNIFTRRDNPDILGTSTAARRLFLNEGILAFLVASAHPKCGDADLKSLLCIWAEVVSGVCGCLEVVAAQHPSLIAPFGMHSIATSIISGDHPLAAQLHAEGDKSREDRTIGSAIALLATTVMYGDAATCDCIGRIGAVKIVSRYFVRRVGEIMETDQGGRPICLDSETAACINQSARFLSGAFDRLRSSEAGSRWDEVRTVPEAVNETDAAEFAKTRDLARRLVRRLAHDGPLEQISAMRHLLILLTIDLDPDQGDLAAVMSVLCRRDGRQFTDVVILNNAIQYCALAMADHMPQGADRFIPVTPTSVKDEGWSLLMEWLDEFLKQSIPPELDDSKALLARCMQHAVENPGERIHFAFSRKLSQTPNGSRNIELPAQAVLNNDKRTAFGLACANCGVSEAAPGVQLNKCATCMKVHYCCRPCQKRDWKHHKPICAQQK